MFLRKFLDLGKKAAFFHLLASCSNSQTSTTQNAENHPPAAFKDYSLKELVQQKLHHGKQRFINPFTDKQHGNMLRVLHWKLFSENKFSSYYHQEEVVPVSIDWRPIREHRDLSITFLKHASVIIKDRDKYIVVDPVFSEIFSFHEKGRMALWNSPSEMRP